ncbi:MAG: hypothetical protein Q8N36_04935, partial [bacterium]|nr:hypothetical protein [bacterium]
MAKLLLGDMLIELLGDGQIADAIRKEFSCLHSGEGTPHLSFHLVSDLPHWEQGEKVHMVGDFSASARTVEFSPDAPCRMRLQINEDGHWNVWCKALPSSEQKAMSQRPIIWQRWRSRNFLSTNEAIGVNIVFGPLVALLHLRLLNMNGALLHGAAIAKDGQGVLLSGWGGSGKTSLLGSIAVQEKTNWEFLGDDLALLDSQGNLSVVPLAIHLKSYNLTVAEKLYAKVKKGNPFLEHWHWLYRLKTSTLKPMRRPRLEELFQLPASNRPISLAVHFDRYSGEEFIVSELSAKEFSGVVTAGTLNEYRCILGSLLKASGLPIEVAEKSFSTVTDLWLNTENI